MQACCRFPAYVHADFLLHALPSPQVSTQLLSIRAVLQCLQTMTAVPLAEELVLKAAPQPSDYLAAAVVAEVGACLSVGQLAAAAFTSLVQPQCNAGIGECMQGMPAPQ
jgi:thioredoxin-like negative regulator of GroEL